MATSKMAMGLMKLNIIFFLKEVKGCPGGRNKPIFFNTALLMLILSAKLYRSSDVPTSKYTVVVLFAFLFKFALIFYAILILI